MSCLQSKRVDFLNWDSDEERKRSQKGVEFRRKQKQRKMAVRGDGRLAEEAWNALMEAENFGDISEFAGAQENHIFHVMLKALFDSFKRSDLWPDYRNLPSPMRPRDYLHYLHRARVSFDDLRDNNQHDFVRILHNIGSDPAFQARFLRPVISATSSDDTQDSARGARRHNENARGNDGGVRRRDENDSGSDDDSVARPRRRQRR